MALKIWIGENLDRRHEQEQMKEFLSLMHAFYDNQPSTVHVLCNFICGGSQIDAAVVKTDAFISIEFKTANGPVSGSENGKWSFEDPDSCREVQLGGGSHAANPYSQVANARTAVAHKLEGNENVFFRPHECDRIADWRHFVHGLVVLAPNLEDGIVDEIDVDFYAKPWFDYCRIKDVAEVVSKTTTRDGELSNKNILKIISQVLHLEEAQMRNGVPMLPGGEDFDDEHNVEECRTKSSDSFGQTLGDIFTLLNRAPEKKSDANQQVKKQTAASIKIENAKSARETNQTLKSSPPTSSPLPKSAPTIMTGRALPIADPQVKTALENIKGFVCEDLPEYVEGTAVACARSNAANLPVAIEGDWDYVIELRYKGNAERALTAVNEYWTCPYTRPYVVDDVIVWRFPEASNHSDNSNENIGTTLQGIGFLPPVIEDFIAEHPNARYSPDALAASSNLSADMQRAEWYLGTYFPRSFCETFAIFDFIFAKKQSELKLEEKVTILDIGIGSGGASYGLIWALRKWFKNKIKEIDVIGYDGNDHALELCGQLSCALISRWAVALHVNTTSIKVAKDTFEAVANQKFDFVLASKAIQEMNGRFDYDDYVSLTKSVLKPAGIAMLLEIFGEGRQSQIKASLKPLSDDRRIVASSIEGPSGSTFGVISNLTAQIMEESISFAAWGGVELNGEKRSETEVVCRKPRKKTVCRRSVAPQILI